MKSCILSIAFIFICISNSIGNDLIGELSGQFRQGNAREISKYFSPTVNLSILNDNNVYSKVQAEIILESFFKMNSPTGSKVIHRLDSNPNYQHAVIELNTIKGYFRVSYSIRINDNKAQVVEIRIEKTID
ncbi:DUF4783 domain-containing protein [Albibacterium bauzanense]|uniref:Uncharacterized protein DUF4783 n=1 Tax=Albibacterium bauzanense TaxID=653929 RepID=A0A4R1M3C7_9SPHI|nr:DUF4783 domain-containing protein [Albibacterium bauzanense]TCK85354.1 uncharacterized protein DUF4783 [Albibacterium bauzanense]